MMAKRLFAFIPVLDKIILSTQQPCVLREDHQVVAAPTHPGV